MTLQNGSSDCHINLPKIKFTQLFIDGQFVDAVSGKTFETIDPRNGEVIAIIAEGDKDDIDLAVKAARHAFDNGPWPRFPASERRRMMLKFADLIDQNIEELAALDSLDAGKLYSIGKLSDIPNAAEKLRYYAGAADKIHGSTLKMSGQLHGYTLREPIGVVGLINPWNFPSQMFTMKVGPALAAGCTMVVKPAEQTPLSALFLAHLAKLAGIPDGVLNVVTGYGYSAGAAISSHMDIDKVSFTGSTVVGRLVMQAAAASNLKPVTLELGGKSPFIIFDDVDVDKVAALALRAIVYNKGEKSVLPVRAFLFNTMRPQVDEKQYNKILSYIEIGKKEGATLLAGGKPAANKGYYIEPTIFTDVTDDMTIAKEEIFGPVMSLMKFKSVEEAIKRGNATKYGLAAGVMTNDLNIANTVSRSIRAGMVWINCYLAFSDALPFGGCKMSGFGREMGMESLDSYLQIKSVAMPIHNSPWL
ncbi:Aldehyde dehydrogenase 2 member C4 [Salvia divinorum]|uniref:Aldehyde dehydrogenase 2 member C4 n=1 Tax=Salvia divinorum TaxID=28513 RepID=A0ABD1I3T4_SALDI